MASALRPLIRYSHILSSAVRDVLENEPLEEAGGRGMTPRQFHLLEFIARGAHHIDDVAKFLCITPPAATKAVDKLEQRGLVVRGGSSDDRRLTLLACSARGAELVERYRTLQHATLANAIGGFADDEIDALAHSLERYALALVAADTRGDGPCLRCSGYDDHDCPIQFTHKGCAYSARREES